MDNSSIVCLLEKGWAGKLEGPYSLLLSLRFSFADKYLLGVLNLPQRTMNTWQDISRESYQMKKQVAERAKLFTSGFLKW